MRVRINAFNIGNSIATQVLYTAFFIRSKDETGRVFHRRLHPSYEES